MNKIFHTIEIMDPGVIQQIQEMLPDHNIYSRQERENPFALYCGFLDVNRAVETQDIEKLKQFLQIENRGLHSQIKQLKDECEISHNVSELFVHKESQLKDRITELEQRLQGIQD